MFGIASQEIFDLEGELLAMCEAKPTTLSVGGPGDGLGLTCLLSIGIGCGWRLR
jgi:hypothetical protein